MFEINLNLHIYFLTFIIHTKKLKKYQDHFLSSYLGICTQTQEN